MLGIESGINRLMIKDKPLLLHVITSTDVGGAETMLLKLCKSIESKGIRNVVISLKPKGRIAFELEQAGISVYSMEMNKGFSQFLKSVISLRRLLNQLEPTVIFSWMYHSNLITWFANFMRYRRAPLIWNIRQCLPSINEQTTSTVVIMLSALLSYFVPRIVYNSKLSIKHHTNVGFKSTNAKFIPNGFDTNRFSFNSIKRQELRTKYGLEDSFVVGIVGRYDPIKGHDLFVQSIAQSNLDNIKGMLVGRGLNNDSLNIRTESQKSRFLIIDESDQIEDYYCVFDVAVCCSISEGFPNVVGEAMCCERPVIVTDVGDSAYLVGDNGIVIEPKSVEKLMTEINTFLNMPQVQRERIGSGLRSRIEMNFTIDHVSDLFISLASEL